MTNCNCTLPFEQCCGKNQFNKSLGDIYKTPTLSNIPDPEEE